MWLVLHTIYSRATFSIRKDVVYRLFTHKCVPHVAYLCYKLTIVLQLTHIKIGDFPGNVVLPAKLFQSREKVRLFTLSLN